MPQLEGKAALVTVAVVSVAIGFIIGYKMSEKKAKSR